MRSWCAVAVAALVLAGCSSGEEEAAGEPAAECVALDAASLEGLAEGLTVEAELEAGQAVELTEAEADLGVEWVAGVRVDDGESSEDVVLGMGAPEAGGGPIIAADNVARVFFDWGEAATDDSPMGAYRDGLFLTDEAETALGCL